MSHRRMFAVVASLAAAFTLTVTATAQSDNRSTMVMDDGQNRYVLHYAEPDVQLAVRPDVVPTDLPLFQEPLTLSAAQTEAVRRLIDEYVMAYEELLRTRHPDPEAEDEADGGEPTLADAAVRAVAPDPVRDIIADELRTAGFDVGDIDSFPYQPSVSVGISIEQSGDGPPTPSVDVSVSFGGDDDSMTEETRDRLQEVADRIVPRIAEHAQAMLEEQMAGGGGPGAMLGGGGGPRARIEARWNEIQALRARIDEFLDAKRTLFSRFTTDVQALLAETQLEQWPAWDRLFTRVKTLRYGRLDGEGIDLIAVAEETIDETPDAVRELLAAYELELHSALKRRNRLLESIDVEIDNALFEGRTSEALASANRVTRARVSVRETNDRYLDAIDAALPAESAGVFRQVALAEGYPRIYRPTQAHEAFDRAAGFELTSDVRGSIDAMQVAYAAQLEAMNERLYRSVRRHQADELRASIERVISTIEGGEFDPGDNPRAEILDAFRSRQQLDARTMRSIYALLNAEQIARMPRLPETDLAEPVTAEHFEEGFVDDD